MFRIRPALGLVLLFLAAPIFAKSHVPTANTKSAIKKYVQDAASFVAKNGADCKALSSADWKSGDYYIFVDAGGKTVCHPDPKIVGKSTADIVDANGKKVGIEIQQAAKKGGWVDYVWPRPGTTKPVAKSTYVTSVKGRDGKTYVVGAGGYELK